MKANVLKNTFFGVLTLLLSVVVGQAMAQDNQWIEEVKIIKSDIFSELKSLLNDNFDYADVDAFSGVYNSEVKFDIAENGQVSNIMVNGKNKEINQEIEETLQELLYKFDKKTLNKNMMAHTFVMPVQLILEK